MSIRLKTATVATAAILACGTLAAIAAAWPPLTSSGTTQTQMNDVSETTSTSTSSTSWVAVSGASTTVTVPAGTTRLINARFTAESRCTGGSSTVAAWCPVKITTQMNVPFSQPVEMDPQSGTDFAFDSVPAGVGGNDYWEGNAMERSTATRLSAGTYTIQVWYCVTPTSATRFDLDDWHLAVETSA